MFTAHPTPSGRAVKTFGECGFQYACRSPSRVGMRKSYGTTPSSFPFQVRSSGGLRSSV